MSYANNITRLTEIAAREYLKTIAFDSINSDNIVAGFDYEDLPAPRVVCCCNNATPRAPVDDLTWDCELEVEVISNADDQQFETQQDAHHTRSGEVFSQFFQGRFETADLISAAAQAYGMAWTCHDIMPSVQTKEIQNRQFRSKITLKIICCGSIV